MPVPRRVAVAAAAEHHALGSTELDPNADEDLDVAVVGSSSRSMNDDIGRLTSKRAAFDTGWKTMSMTK